MATGIALSATARNEAFKPHALRRQGIIPAVIYGHLFAPRAVQLDAFTAQRVVHQAGTSQLVNLTIAGDDEEHMVLIREVQRDPITDYIIHLDLYRLVADETVTTEIPVILRGVAPVIESLGGIVNQLVDTLEIECLPRDIPHSLEIDVTSLVDFDSVLTVADLAIPEGVQVLVPMDTELVRVLAPRTEEEVAEAATVTAPEEAAAEKAAPEAEAAKTE